MPSRPRTCFFPTTASTITLNGIVHHPHLTENPKKPTNKSTATETPTTKPNSPMSSSEAPPLSKA
ncbi:MAG: hypothetical protein Q9212_005720 [Teloschistes hypoglaucus]